MRPDAPAGLIAICRKMMAKSANDRYQSADQVSQILTEWLASGDDGCSGSAAAPSAPSGASLNEDLTLAPLDDEPASRRGARQPGESSTSGVASKSGPIKEPSGVKPNQPSGIKNAGLSSAKNGASQPVKKGESSSIHGPDLTAAKGPQKPKSGVRTPVPTLPNLDKPHDLMDELLSAPALPPVEQLKSGPLPTVRRHEEQHPMMSSIAIVVGMGLLGTAIIVGVVMLLIKYAGL